MWYCNGYAGVSSGGSAPLLSCWTVFRPQPTKAAWVALMYFRSKYCFAKIETELGVAQDVACCLGLRAVEANDETLDRLQLLQEATTYHRLTAFGQQRPQVGPLQSAMGAGQDRQDRVNTWVCSVPPQRRFWSSSHRSKYAPKPGRICARSPMVSRGAASPMPQMSSA